MSRRTTASQASAARRSRSGTTERPGLKQIAGDLDLAVSTVSHALRGDGTVSDDTRRRVREYAAQVGYTANAHARRMRATSTAIIGLVIPDVVLTYSEFVQKVFRLVAQTGRELQIVLSEFDADLEDHALRTLMGQRVDGVLLKSTFRHMEQVPDDHALRTLVASKTPAVVIGDELRGSGLPCCRTPTEVFARMLVADAIERGHKRVDWLFPLDLRRTPLESLPQHRRAIRAAEEEGQRLAGADFRLRLRTLDELPDDDVGDVDPPNGDEQFGTYLNESLPTRALKFGKALARRALAGPDRADVLICINDVIATGAMAAANEARLSIPRDVVIGTYHATVAGQLAPRPMTVAGIDPGEMARATLSTLDAVIAGKTSPAIDLSPQLTTIGGLVA
ncbi:MAG: LacI family DNA-binding transcriptional regulator [Planctomycetota bacterium]